MICLNWWENDEQGVTTVWKVVQISVKNELRIGCLLVRFLLYDTMYRCWAVADCHLTAGESIAMEKKATTNLKIAAKDAVLNAVTTIFSMSVNCDEETGRIHCYRGPRSTDSTCASNLRSFGCGRIAPLQCTPRSMWLWWLWLTPSGEYWVRQQTSWLQQKNFPCT